MTCGMPGPSSDMTVMIRNSHGKACTASTTRCPIRSATPPKYPSRSPNTVATTTATRLEAMPTSIEMRAPCTTRLYTSRPN